MCKTGTAVPVTKLRRRLGKETDDRGMCKVLSAKGEVLSAKGKVEPSTQREWKAIHNTRHLPVTPLPPAAPQTPGAGNTLGYSK